MWWAAALSAPVPWQPAALNCVNRNSLLICIYTLRSRTRTGRYSSNLLVTFLCCLELELILNYEKLPSWIETKLAKKITSTNTFRLGNEKHWAVYPHTYLGGSLENILFRISNRACGHTSPPFLLSNSNGSLSLPPNPRSMVKLKTAALKVRRG